MEAGPTPGNPKPVNYTDESFAFRSGFKAMSSREKFETDKKLLLINGRRGSVYDKEFETINKIQDEEQGIEDEHKSAHYFNKLFIQELTLAIFYIIGIV
jgi:hypothetical protein